MNNYEVKMIATFGAHTDQPEQTRGTEIIEAKDIETAKQIARVRFETELEAAGIPAEDVPFKITKVTKL